MDEEREAPLDELEVVDEAEETSDIGDAAHSAYCITPGCNGGGAKV